MIQRYLKIKNFRNIGDDEYQKLELNSVKQASDKFGGLVTLIGLNNTGKSNYLDALKVVANKRCEKNDYPNFKYDPNIKPTVTLWLQDTTEKTDYSYKVYGEKTHADKWVEEKKVEIGSNKKEGNNLDQATLNAVRGMREYHDFFRVLKNAYSTWKSSTETAIEIPFNNNQPYFNQCLDKILENKGGPTEFKELVKFTSMPKFKELFSDHFREYDISVEGVIENLQEQIDLNNKRPLFDEVYKKYKIQLKPEIVTYDDKFTFKQSDMTSSIEGYVLSNQSFFKTLFSILKKTSYEELENAYKLFKDSHNGKHILTNFTKKVNSELKIVAKTFNKVYGLNNDKIYSFKLDLESNRVYFIISENGIDVSFDSQSTGFRWFFNFFFTVFANDKIKNGDIVILDEPATNLHVSGQIELRKQIKQFGHENGITFVLSTHSPFLIDIDYLDEIRVVSKKDMFSVVENKFSVSEDQLVDVLLPIQSSLTTARHIINDPNKVLIFVEGITDYNYLVAFKELLDFNNLSFLPIQGIKKADTVFNKLIEISKSPILLVDSDYQGLKAKEVSNKEKYKGIEIREISEIDPKLKFIEDLFTQKDREKYAYDKNYSLSSHFKNNIRIFKDELDKVTIENFKKLFDVLNT